jgi:hypothetical protein
MQDVGAVHQVEFRLELFLVDDLLLFLARNLIPGWFVNHQGDPMVDCTHEEDKN